MAYFSRTIFFTIVLVTALLFGFWWYGGVGAGFTTNVTLSSSFSGSEWSFDGDAVTPATATDSSPGGNHITLFNTPAPTFGRIGQALRFNGTTQFGSAGDIGIMRGVSFWLKPSSITAQGILQFSGSSYVSMDGSGTITTTGITSPTIYINGTESTTVTSTDWHHVLITTDTNITASSFEVGRANGSYFGGILDDVRTSTTEYTQRDVVRLYGVGM
jgi:hypothetical protein